MPEKDSDSVHVLCAGGRKFILGQFHSRAGPSPVPLADCPSARRGWQLLAGGVHVMRRSDGKDTLPMLLLL